MNKAKWLVVLLLGAAVAACGGSSGLKEQTQQERVEEVTRIKTQLAIQFMQAGDYRQAVSTINEAVQGNSRDVNAWLIRAQIWQYLKDAAKAEESFRRALTLKPDSAEVNNNYGWFLCDMRGQPQAALAYFDKALADPTYPTPEVAYLNKGICTSRLGQYNLAKAYFERALERNPNFVVAQREMARSALSAGRLQDADYLFRQYQRRVDKLSASDLLLGWKITRALGYDQAAYEYQAQLQNNYPYSEETQQVSTGQMP